MTAKYGMIKRYDPAGAYLFSLLIYIYAHPGDDAQT